MEKLQAQEKPLKNQVKNLRHEYNDVVSENSASTLALENES